MTFKSRILTKHELFIILQKEFIVCELRAEIYPKLVITKEGKESSPSSYWIETSLGKKERVVKLANELGVVSIFDDKFLKNAMDSEVIPELGFPKFIYKDELHKLKQEKWDKQNYFSKGALMKIYDNGVFIEGKINWVDFSKNTANVDVDGSKKRFTLDCLTRIFKK